MSYGGQSAFLTLDELDWWTPERCDFSVCWPDGWPTEPEPEPEPEPDEFELMVIGSWGWTVDT